jgi:hypothetical protein
MSRIKGKSIIFSLDDIDYAGAVKSVKFSSAVGEMGFGNYEDNLDFTCQVTGFQDVADASLWSSLYATPGAQVELTFAPYGNEVASNNQPHFVASGYAETLPDLGGAAGEYFVYDLTFILDGKPQRVTA